MLFPSCSASSNMAFFCLRCLFSFLNKSYHLYQTHIPFSSFLFIIVINLSPLIKAILFREVSCLNKGYCIRKDISVQPVKPNLSPNMMPFLFVIFKVTFSIAHLKIKCEYFAISSTTFFVCPYCTFVKFF